jgi:Leucine Rich repeat
MPTEPTKADPPIRNRRRVQFSLRSLMIFTLICAVAAGWLCKKIEKKSKEQEAVKAIVKSRGEVMYDSGSRPPGPGWLRGLLGEHFFSQVDQVTLHHATDTELECLEKLPDLVSVDLEGARITDVGLLHLRGLTRLEYLDLRGTKVTDVGIVNLLSLSNLKVLKLQGTAVTDDGRQPLYALKHCWIDR